MALRLQPSPGCSEFTAPSLVGSPVLSLFHSDPAQATWPSLLIFKHGVACGSCCGAFVLAHSPAVEDFADPPPSALGGGEGSTPHPVPAVQR